MFWSDDLLTAKRGSFGIVWLAATLGPRNKRITRKQLTTVDLTKTCELIQDPPEPMALRLSGCLLVGVARVYNQNYELFYTDVNNFHQSLRIATDFSTTAQISTVGSDGLDLPGGGKSKLDQITFAGIDVGWRSALSLEFANIDWTNPIGKRSKRRGTSKLDSLQSQKSETQESEDTDTDIEEDLADDDDLLLYSPETRRRRKNDLSSSRLERTLKLPHRAMSRPPSNHPDDQALLVPIDLELDLDLPLIDGGNDSFSAPLGAAADLPPDFDRDQQNQQDEFFMIPPDQPLRELITDVAEEHTTAAKGSRTKRKIFDGSEEESVVDVEEFLEPKPRRKKTKTVIIDDDLEISEVLLSDAHYEASMNRENKLISFRENQKQLIGRADELVDGGGKWIEFLDPEMNRFFATFTKAPKFRWEQELQATKRGRNWAPEKSPGWMDKDAPGELHDFGPTVENEFPTVDANMEQYPDTVGLEPLLLAGRAASLDDVERARKMSTQTGRRESQLPWNDLTFDTPAGGFMSDFTPGSRRLSVMTPQEARIRLNTHNKSSSQVRSRRYRSRSASLIDPGSEALMLAPGNDHDDDIAESQMSQFERKRGDVPNAFKPEYLAVLEKQCRSFMTFIEKKMLDEEKSELGFGDLVAAGDKKVYAALAFHNCLTLATKSILRVRQPKPWEGIIIHFATALHI
ncbi:Rec8 like protein-domain-containing protein [Naematelia encephala]|uniref:Rec8 like protein-domain-containing protein n=1 Tax=Naematelia encephala TaxID=71784 RepID=A0A1Y2AIG1_9TREE|nr:Rec8 like protein-domain-containing protein [Naematelia encephala]